MGTSFLRISETQPTYTHTHTSFSQFSISREFRLFLSIPFLTHRKKREKRYFLGKSGNGKSFSTIRFITVISRRLNVKPFSDNDDDIEMFEMDPRKQGRVARLSDCQIVWLPDYQKIIGQSWS